MHVNPKGSERSNHHHLRVLGEPYSVSNLQSHLQFGICVPEPVPDPWSARIHVLKRLQGLGSTLSLGRKPRGVGGCRIKSGWVELRWLDITQGTVGECWLLRGLTSYSLLLTSYFSLLTPYFLLLTPYFLLLLLTPYILLLTSYSLLLTSYQGRWTMLPPLVLLDQITSREKIP